MRYALRHGRQKFWSSSEPDGVFFNTGVTILALVPEMLTDICYPGNNPGYPGRTVPKTRLKAFYTKTAQNRAKLSETANWLWKYQIDTWTDIRFVKFKVSNVWKL